MKKTTISLKPFKAGCAFT